MSGDIFKYSKATREYRAVVDGIALVIDDRQMTDEVMEITREIIKRYPLVRGLVEDILLHDEETAEIFARAGNGPDSGTFAEPVIKIDRTGGVLSYYLKDGGDIHVAELEFGGALEAFYETNAEKYSVMGG